jgi:hypothetical protein
MTNLSPISTVPLGRKFVGRVHQTLRVWLISNVPSERVRGRPANFQRQRRGIFVVHCSQSEKAPSGAAYFV